MAVPSGAVRFTSRPYRKLDFFEQDRSSIGSVVRVPRSRRSSAMWTLARVSLIAVRHRAGPENYALAAFTDYAGVFRV